MERLIYYICQIATDYAMPAMAMTAHVRTLLEEIEELIASERDSRTKMHMIHELVDTICRYETLSVIALICIIEGTQFKYIGIYQNVIMNSLKEHHNESDRAATVTEGIVRAHVQELDTANSLANICDDYFQLKEIFRILSDITHIDAESFLIETFMSYSTTDDRFFICRMKDVLEDDYSQLCSIIQTIFTEHACQNVGSTVSATMLSMQHIFERSIPLIIDSVSDIMHEFKTHLDIKPIIRKYYAKLKLNIINKWQTQINVQEYFSYPDIDRVCFETFRYICDYVFNIFAHSITSRIIDLCLYAYHKGVKRYDDTDFLVGRIHWYFDVDFGPLTFGVIFQVLEATDKLSKYIYSTVDIQKQIELIKSRRRLEPNVRYR